ncbi:MAG: bactofilin family protein [Polyangiales bacterium]
MTNALSPSIAPGVAPGAAVVLAADQRFEGTLCFGGRTRIDGHVRGSVIGEGTLHVGPQAHIEGEVQVRALVIEGGHLHGEVRAYEFVELRAGAYVSGQVECPLVVKEDDTRFEAQWRQS